MKYADHTRGYVLKLEKGEELEKNLINFAIEKRIPSAFFQGIGTLKNIELGYLDPEDKSYKTTSFKGSYELISINGNISDVSGKPSIHCHAILSDEKCRTIGGHLIKGSVSSSVEIFLFPLDIVLLREEGPLHELDLPHCFCS